jgi:hypothetical protein
MSLNDRRYQVYDSNNDSLSNIKMKSLYLDDFMDIEFNKR